MRPNLYENTTAVRTLSPAVRTATATGITVDRQQSGTSFQDAMVVVSTGTITDGTHTVEVQDSPDGTTWTPVADAFLQGAEPAIAAADDDKIFVIGYLGDQRYLRIVISAAGTTSGGAVGAVIVLGNSRRGAVVHS
jgi:hypothetical protein